MSVVGCLPNRSVVVIGTDTRLVRSVDGSRADVWDDATKLHHWNHGWFAGVGHHGTLEVSKDNLRRGQIRNDGDVREALESAWASELIPQRVLHPQMRTALDRTYAALSIATTDGMEAVYYAPGICGPGIMRFPSGLLRAFGPSDMTAEELMEVVMGHQLQDPSDDLSLRVVQAVTAMAGFIADIASCSVDVSATADIGVHFSPGASTREFVRYKGPAAEMALCTAQAALDRFEVAIVG